jgi:transposase
VVVDPESGVASEDRFPASPDELGRWAERRLDGEPCAVAIEATTGWRWVHRELSARGIDVRLAEPLQTRARRGRRRGAKTDRLDARWLALLRVTGRLLTDVVCVATGQFRPATAGPSRPAAWWARPSIS